MIICCGMVLADCIVTESGSEDVADDIALSPGGEALNEAIGLARLGETVLLCAPVAHDFAGKAIRELLRAEGVQVVSDHDGPTPVSLLTVDAAGERRSRVSKAHGLAGWRPRLPMAQASDDIGAGDPGVLTDPERSSGRTSDETLYMVTMASLFRPPFLDPDACLSFALDVKAAGALLLADTKMPKGARPVLSDYARTLALLDFITPNEEEALYYTGTQNAPDAARVFRSFGVRNVIIKRGPEGCLCLPEDGEEFECRAYPVSCVDGIGAGDAFAAGLISRLAAGDTLSDAVRFASACGAVSTTKRGAVSAIRSQAQIREFINKNS